MARDRLVHPAELEQGIRAIAESHGAERIALERALEAGQRIRVTSSPEVRVAFVVQVAHRGTERRPRPRVSRWWWWWRLDT